MLLGKATVDELLLSRLLTAECVSEFVCRFESVRMMTSI
jgi:hypothetical protein